MQLSDGRTVSWIGIEPEDEATHNGLKIAADVDFASFLLLWHNGLLLYSTYAWISSHCIEKYFKSLLLKNDPNTDIRSYGHNLRELWNDSKPFFSRNVADYEVFINELEDVKTSIRYGQNSILCSSGLLAIFSILTTELRYLILQKDEYRELNYGLKPSLLLPRFYNSCTSNENIIYKILHWLIDHQYTFSSLGIPDSFSFAGIDVDIIHLKQKHEDIIADCPLCSGRIVATDSPQSPKVSNELQLYFSNDIR